MFKAVAVFKQYSSIEEAKEAFMNGRDFKIMQGPYFSIRDFNEMKKQALGSRIDKVMGSALRPIISVAVPINGILQYFEVMEDGTIK